jgi:hypothetical protein
MNQHDALSAMRLGRSIARAGGQYRSDFFAGNFVLQLAYQSGFMFEMQVIENEQHMLKMVAAYNVGHGAARQGKPLGWARMSEMDLQFAYQSGWF